MLKAPRAVIVTAFIGLILAPTAGAATTTRDYFIARDACGGQGVAQNLRLDISPGAYAGSCGSLTAILGGSTEAYPATSGVPVTVDGSRKADIYIGVDSFTGPPLGGIGDQTVKVELLGRTATNPRVRMGTATETVAAADMLRRGSYIAEFHLTVPGGLYTGITLNLTVGGSQQQGYINYDGTSAVTLPII